MSSRALIVFAKNPVPGVVKTRLGSRLGVGMAAQLFEAFLLDTLHRCRTLDASVRLYLAPTDVAVAPTVIPFDSLRLRQRGRGLGKRMENALSETFLAGYQQVVLIGADVPTLPLSRIRRAFSLLDVPKTIVLGPSFDGGYHLVGLSEPVSQVFAGMSYGHSAVLTDTLKRARSAGLRPVTLEPWYDIDTVEDIRRLADDLRTSDVDCPYTLSKLLNAGLIENTSFDAGSASEK